MLATCVSYWTGAMKPPLAPCATVPLLAPLRCRLLAKWLRLLLLDATRSRMAPCNERARPWPLVLLGLFGKCGRATPMF